VLTLQNRIALLSQLKKYLLADTPEWIAARKNAGEQNGWFIPAFINQSVQSIAHQFLDEDALLNWVKRYHIDDNISPRRVGIVMAGNIPLVGFHDMLSGMGAGHP
jgi:hypothetical protein